MGDDSKASNTGNLDVDSRLSRTGNLDVDGKLGSEGIKVLIIDDDPIVRASLATILGAGADIIICGEGGDGQEAVALYDALLPDIALMDIQMPKCSGIEAADAILACHPEARIVLLTTFSDDEYIVSALRLGVKGYLIKQDVTRIAPALKAVMAGQIVLGGEVMDRMAHFGAKARPASAATTMPPPATTATPVATPATAASNLGTAAEDRTSSAKTRMGIGSVASGQLTEREQEIIALIATGLGNKEIAERLFISEGTLRNHISSMLQKLQLKNRTQLAIYYFNELNV